MKNIIIITGGAGGMGLETAKILGNENYLVLSDIREEPLKKAIEELKKLNIESDYFVGDITNNDSVIDLMKFAKTKGKIVSMVHTAGVSPLMGDADFILKINALGTIYLTNAFYEFAAKGANLVNVASMAGYLIPNFIVPKKGYEYSLTNLDKFMKKLNKRVNLFPKKQRSGLAYSISKNFVIWFSKRVTKKFGQKDMRIVSVSPGTFNTEMGKLEEKSGSAKLAKASALGRVGNVEEIANILAFCTSDKASYLTGTDILCDGGTVSSVPLKEMSKIVSQK